jgi:hypothetical protein
MPVLSSQGIRNDKDAKPSYIDCALMRQLIWLKLSKLKLFFFRINKKF